MHGIQSLAQLAAKIAARSFVQETEKLVDTAEYRASKLVKDLVKGKHGDDIFVMGSTLEEIRSFWKHVGYQAEGPLEPPKEVTRTVVDIDCKCHGNYAGTDGVQEGAGAKPEDWYDEFKITSKKSKDDSMHKGYTLQTSEKEGFQIGGHGGLSASSSFFNVAGGGITPELGINASFTSETSRVKTEERSRDTKLSQAYEILDCLKVPPRKEVKAKITTYAVTYEAKTTLRYTVDADISLPVRYRNHLSRLLGGFYVSTTYLSAREIFRDETDFAFQGTNVTFTREGTVSYIGEQVDIQKEKKDLDL